MNYDTATIWGIIAVMGVGTFLIRFSFLGIIGDRELPPWVLRLLRFTPVAVIPGLVAPLVVRPGEPFDLAIAAAAAATLIGGYWSKNLPVAIVAGVLGYFAVEFL
ncbi:MAG: AzlD domain-containing protein [Pseudomonadota bacterium]